MRPLGPLLLGSLLLGSLLLGSLLLASLLVACGAQPQPGPPAQPSPSTPEATPSGRADTPTPAAPEAVDDSVTAERRARRRVRPGVVRVIGVPDGVRTTLGDRSFTDQISVPPGRHVLTGTRDDRLVVRLDVEVESGGEAVLDLSSVPASDTDGDVAGVPLVDPTLDWLTEQQAKDGSFHAEGFDDVDTTGLVLLSLFGAGETHNAGAFKAPVRNALRFLRSRQDDEGAFASGPRWVHDHAVATLAMTEAYGVTGSRLFKDRAQRAVDALERTRIRGLGWRAGDGGSIDIETTVWATMAFRSARYAELVVSDEDWRDTGLLVRRLADVGNPSVSPRHVAMLTFALCLTSEGEPPDDPLVVAGVERMLAESLTHDATFDPMYAHFATLALFQHGGRAWKDWNRLVKAAVVDHYGSAQLVTDPDATLPSAAVRAEGRLRTWTWTTLVQEVYYRNARVFGCRR